MKTSWIETKEIEEYLQGKLEPATGLLFKADLLINPELETTTTFQQKTYKLVTAYARKKLKAELAQIEQKLFQQQEHRSFRKKILSIFNGH